jgi:hypothetical protein
MLCMNRKVYELLIQYHQILVSPNFELHSSDSKEYNLVVPRTLLDIQMFHEIKQLNCNFDPQFVKFVEYDIGNSLSLPVCSITTMHNIHDKEIMLNHSEIPPYYWVDKNSSSTDAIAHCCYRKSVDAKEPITSINIDYEFDNEYDWDYDNWIQYYKTTSTTNTTM